MLLRPSCKVEIMLYKVNVQVSDHGTRIRMPWAGEAIIPSDQLVLKSSNHISDISTGSDLHIHHILAYKSFVSSFQDVWFPRRKAKRLRIRIFYLGAPLEEREMGICGVTMK